MTVNIEKSAFFPEALEYLGHIISCGEIRPNLKKVSALDTIKKLATVAEVRSLLGFLGYFQPFLPNYAETTTSMTDLLKGQSARSQARITWTDEHELAVRRLVNQLKEATLTIPLEQDELKVETGCIRRGSRRCAVHETAGALETYPVCQQETFADAAEVAHQRERSVRNRLLLTEIRLLYAGAQVHRIHRSSKLAMAI